MNPLHAHLYAMDGSRAYLARLAEFEAQYHAARGRKSRLTVRALYQEVRANFCRHYPHLTPPAAPPYLLHR